jgi:arylsulfatase A-like enzyme
MNRDRETFWRVFLIGEMDDRFDGALDALGAHARADDTTIVGDYATESCVRCGDATVPGAYARRCRAHLNDELPPGWWA